MGEVANTKERVNEKDRAFLRNLLDGGGLVESAKKAGYHQSELYHTAMPKLQTQLAEMVARRDMTMKLKFEAAPKAYKVLIDMLDDKETPKSIRVEIAKYLHSVAGYTPPKAQEAPAPAKNEKDLNDMTTEELRQFIQEGEKELANRAIDISPPQTIEDML